MFAMPVVERELRVRTRTRVTHWQRLLVAALAGLACFFRQVRLPLIVLGGPVILLQLGLAPYTMHLPFQLLHVLTDWLMIFTIGWVGMYCGSRAPTPSLALGRTLLMCVVAPLLGTWVLSVLIVLLVPRTLSGPVNNRWLFWISWIVRLGYTIGLLVWARRRLAEDFRKIVSGD